MTLPFWMTYFCFRISPDRLGLEMRERELSSISHQISHK